MRKKIQLMAAALSLSLAAPVCASAQTDSMLPKEASGEETPGADENVPDASENGETKDSEDTDAKKCVPPYGYHGRGRFDKFPGRGSGQDTEGEDSVKEAPPALPDGEDPFAQDAPSEAQPEEDTGILPGEDPEEAGLENGDPKDDTDMDKPSRRKQSGSRGFYRNENVGNRPNGMSGFRQDLPSRGFRRGGDFRFGGFRDHKQAKEDTAGKPDSDGAQTEEGQDAPESGTDETEAADADDADDADAHGKAF